ncbi:hypothetical protein [Pedobacter sp.]
MKHIIIIVLCITRLACLGQSNVQDDTAKRQLSFGLGASGTTLLGKNFYGGYLEFRYSPLNRLSTGVDLSFFSKKATDTYGYNVRQPILSNYEIAWLVQYDLIRAKRLNIGFNISNGVNVLQLSDNAEKVKRYSRYGTTMQPKEVAVSYLYQFEPGVDLSYRVISGRKGPDFYLTLKSKYRITGGNPKIGQRSDYQGFMLGAGITIVGLI